MVSVYTSSSEKQREILQHWKHTCTAGLVSPCTLPAVFLFRENSVATICLWWQGGGKKRKKKLKKEKIFLNASQKYKQNGGGGWEVKIQVHEHYNGKRIE